MPVSDQVDAALAAGVDGAPRGADDLPVAVARRTPQWAPTSNPLADLPHRVQAWPRAALGPQALARIPDLPVYALGGATTPAHVQQCAQADATRVAVMAASCARLAPDITAELIVAVTRTRYRRRS